LFSSLGDFDGLTIVDLFAGSGSLGLESASRGAARVVFIEQSKKHCDFIRENIEKVKKAGVLTEFHVIHGDVVRSLGNIRRLVDTVDITFGDPPYPISDSMFSAVSSDPKLTAFDGNELVWEIPDRCDNESAFLLVKLWKMTGVRKFGRTEFRFYSVKK